MTIAHGQKLTVVSCPQTYAFIRAKKVDAFTKTTTRGKQVMKELLDKNIVLVPFAIDPLW